MRVRSCRVFGEEKTHTCTGVLHGDRGGIGAATVVSLGLGGGRCSDVGIGRVVLQRKAGAGGVRRREGSGLLVGRVGVGMNSVGRMLMQSRRDGGLLVGLERMMLPERIRLWT